MEAIDQFVEGFAVVETNGGVAPLAGGAMVCLSDGVIFRSNLNNQLIPFGRADIATIVTMLQRWFPEEFARAARPPVPKVLIVADADADVVAATGPVIVEVVDGDGQLETYEPEITDEAGYQALRKE